MLGVGDTTNSMKRMLTMPAWLLLGLIVCLPGCPNKPSKPLVLTEQVGNIPVEFSSRNCRLPILSTPPTEPHEVLARIKTYGNAKTKKKEMHNMLRGEACAIGAQALVVQQLKTGEFEDEISVQHKGFSTGRDYTSRAEYTYQLIGLAIRYKTESASTQK